MELKSRANILNNILAGKLNLGIIPTVSSYILPNEIFSFLQKNPQIELNIKEMTTESIIKSLKSGELDAGIISTPYSAAEEFYQDFLFNEELMLYSGTETGQKKDCFVVPEDIDVNKVWLLEEGNCLRTQFENICHLKENSLKPKNLEFLASNVNTLIQMVDKVGGITILSEIGVQQLSDEQKQKVSRFIKPFPYREMSLIYYKPTYKQKILDELISEIRTSMEQKLNFYKDRENYKSVKPE
ncbi:Hydrogen peroxide-inducible protein activator [compost metagenome]